MKAGLTGTPIENTVRELKALLDGGRENYQRYESGKWALFKELLEEGLMVMLSVPS